MVILPEVLDESPWLGVDKMDTNLSQNPTNKQQHKI